MISKKKKKIIIKKIWTFHWILLDTIFDWIKNGFNNERKWRFKIKINMQTIKFFLKIKIKKKSNKTKYFKTKQNKKKENFKK